MKLITLLIACISLSSAQVLAQDTLVFMSGQEVPCTILDDSDIDIRYQIIRRNKKKEMLIHRSEIFSITKPGIGESVLYVKDEALGDWLSIEEMRVFIAGEQDASRNFNTKPTFWTGVGLGAIGSYASQGGLITMFATPVAYTTFQLAPNIKIRESTMRHSGYKHNEIYALGYERTARPKKVLAALKGSALGMVVGYLAYLIAPVN